MENLSVANVPTELNALFYVAEARNFFAPNGLEVTLKENYDSGATAAAGMLNGEADIALAAEFPLVRQVFNKKNGGMHLTQVTPTYSIDGYGRLPANADGIRTKI